MNCKKCGSDNIPEAAFCGKCGSELSSFEAAPFFQKEEDVKPIFKPLDTSSELDASAVTDASPAHDASETSVPTNNNSSIAGLRTLPRDNKAKSHKALWITLTSIVIVLALAGGLGFAFRMQIMKSVAPEKYLQLSLVKTFAGAQSESEDMLGLSKFVGKAASHDFLVETDEGSAEGSWKYDSANEKALLDVSIADGEESYVNNKLYLSPELIALSIPDLITETDYITVNPATFVEEWEAKGLDEDMPSMDLEEYVHTIFGKNEVDKNDSQLTSQIADIFTDLTQRAMFSEDGTVDDRINGTDYKMDVMTYMFSEDDVNDFYQELLSIIKENASSGEDLVSTGTSAVIGENTDYIYDALADLEVNGDVVIHYFIDQDGNIRKISADDFEITYEESDTTFGFEIEFGDAVNPTDDMSAVITIEADGDTGEITLDSESSYEDGMYTGSIDLAMGSDDHPEAITISYDVEWDKKDTSGENLDSQIKVDYEGDKIKMTLVGTLTTNDKDTSLSDAVFEYTGEDGESTSVDLSYSVTLIDPSEITVDTTDSIPLLEYEPFLENMNMDSGLAM